VDLSIYNNSDFDSRRLSELIEGIAVEGGALGIHASPLLPKCFALASNLRVALLELFGAKIGKRVIKRGNISI